MIARDDLKAKLLAWHAGEADELATWQWAEQAKKDYANNPPQDELVRDIVDLLAALPYEMIVSDDIEVFLDALANPSDETDLSVNLVWNHMDGFDPDSRRMEYNQHPFYGEFAHAD